MKSWKIITERKINEREKTQIFLCSLCFYDVKQEILVGGGLRNSSNRVFTELYTEILRSNRAKPRLTQLYN